MTKINRNSVVPSLSFSNAALFAPHSILAVPVILYGGLMTNLEHSPRLLVKRGVSEKVKMRNGGTILVMVKDGKVLHYSWNIGLPHVEFVRRATRDLPEGAWVGTVSKSTTKSPPSVQNISSATNSLRRSQFGNHSSVF
jgi:hypothetical protein